MSNVCRDIQKIENLIRQCVQIPQKIYNVTKRLKTPKEVEEYFPGFLSFIDSIEQQIPRLVIRMEENILFEQEEKMYYKESAYG
jgi:hypothetical protein